jgi:hypothetical protein
METAATGFKPRLLGLCGPPLLLCALDGSLTLVGQSAEYWAGAFTQVNEGSPTFNHLLQLHPAAYAAGIVGWAAMFATVILLLPDLGALILSIAVTFGHMAGAATWLLWRFQFGYQACNALFLASAVVLGLGIRWGWRAVPENEYRFRGWPLGTRLLLAAGLIIIGVYLFLWPRTP